jgi:hypothetical protein
VAWMVAKRGAFESPSRSVVATSIMRAHSE